MPGKHILIALHRFQVGGAETQALYLAEYLLNNGYSVTVTAFGSERGDGYERFRGKGLQLIHLGFNERILLEFPKSVKQHLVRLKIMVQLIFQIRKLSVDVVIPFTYPPNVIFGNCWKWMGVRKCFWNQRDAGISFKGIPREYLALSNCSEIISNSTEGKNFLSKHTDRAIHIILNGVKIPTSVGNELSNDELFRVVKVANIHSHKDHQTLLEAWRLLIPILPSNASLVLAGRYGNMYEQCQAFVLKNNMSESVYFLGEVSDVYQLLKSCHVAVFSSQKEGLPNGILEPMAVGLPVVTTNMKGAHDALGESYPFFCEPKNAEDFANKIMFLYNNRSQRIELGKKNYERIQEIFSIELMGGKFLSML